MSCYGQDVLLPLPNDTLFLSYADSVKYHNHDSLYIVESWSHTLNYSRQEDDTWEVSKHPYVTRYTIINNTIAKEYCNKYGGAILYDFVANTYSKKNEDGIIEAEGRINSEKIKCGVWKYYLDGHIVASGEFDGCPSKQIEGFKLLTSFIAPETGLNEQKSIEYESHSSPTGVWYFYNKDGSVRDSTIFKKPANSLDISVPTIW